MLSLCMVYDFFNFNDSHCAMMIYVIFQFVIYSFTYCGSIKAAKKLKKVDMYVKTSIKEYLQF